MHKCDRNEKIDILKGILIICVVIGHYQKDTISNIVFLFHMPLFFIISGALLQDKKMMNRAYIAGKVKGILVPYFCYGILDNLICRRNIKQLINLIWGGRAITGGYWYITCFICAIVLFSCLKQNFSDKTVKYITLAGGVIAVIESHLIDSVPFLKFPGIPWNMDVVPLSLVYLSIGFYYKEQIICILNSEKLRLDIIAVTIFILLLCFSILNYGVAVPWYYFDMKPVYYKELISAILIPCAFGVILARGVFWLEKTKPLQLTRLCLGYLGRITIPIMFLHVPLNTWQEYLGYGRWIYFLIGIGVPTIFSLAFGQFWVMRRLFGLPTQQS